MDRSMDTITCKLQLLEQRLNDENESSRRVFEPPTARRRPQQLPQMGSIPNRSNMTLDFLHSSAPATESEIDIKLRKIHKQTGILTINNHKYKSDIKDLEHLGDLGNGTSGNVVKMRHKPSNTIIAVKQMRRTGNSEENKRILMDLDVVLKSHDCQYIVQCLGCFVTDADVWICMELMSMCFDKVLKLSKRPVPESILGKVTVATVKALSYLKDQQDVIHRDVKPSNILIDERGNIKLCDFGISGRLVDSKAATRSAGCAAYMAPERIDPKKPKYDIRADVWSLGITLVELATARSPYEGCNTDFEVLTKVLAADPPSLPEDETFHFSHEFHDFVKKCLTKNYAFRPKYPQLLEQPFIRYYEAADVDIPQWFKSVVDSAGIKTHRRTQIPTSMIPATYDATKHYKNPLNASSSVSSTSSSSAAAAAATPSSSHVFSNTNPFAGATHTAATTTMTINTATTKSSSAATTSASSSQIPSYYGMGNPTQRNNSFHKHQQQPHHHHHHYQQQQQPSQLPQSINQCNSNTATINNYQGSTLTTASISGGNGKLGGGDLERLPSGGSGSSSATSSSPLSPPSVTSYNLNRDPDTKLVSEMHKLCRKSPFMPKKFNGSSTYNRYQTPGGSGGGDESPKKESVLTTIGQSILRNLTTSPFSQKKHAPSSSVQPHQIDPLFRMPCAQDSTFDTSDTSPSPTANTSITDSPAMQRKRFQMASDSKYGMTAAKKTSSSSTAVDGGYEKQQQQQQEKSSMIPLTKNEAQPQRVPGNHSPIVLQRFYHQQNQMREKEIERQHHQQFSPFYTKHSPSNESGSMSAFHTNYYQTSSPHHQQQQQQQQQPQVGQQQQQYSSHIPIASSSTLSSYSTSSQSSTQSSQCSQIGGEGQQPQQLQHQHHGPRSLPLMTSDTNNKSLTSPASPQQEATLGFGTTAATTSPTTATRGGESHLQYQPLPQQYLTNTSYANMIRNSRSPPTSLETQTDSAGILGDRQLMGGGTSNNQRVGVTSPTVTKLSKLYNQRHMPQGSSNASTSVTNANNTGVGAGGGGAYKENNFKQEGATTSPTNGLNNTASSADTTQCPVVTDNNKSHFYYQRTMSSGSSNSPGNSQATSPLATESSGRSGATEGFHEGSSAGGFIRRYAATTGGGVGANVNTTGPSSSLPATHTPAHILANLDRRHRSPDPPPRYNRGQSPLLLRKNILELSGQPPGTSPLLNRRYVNSSPPLPPPRRGSESVPGSPQHFRTRIHYTPEPQRRVYRTIDQ